MYSSKDKTLHLSDVSDYESDQQLIPIFPSNDSDEDFEGKKNMTLPLLPLKNTVSRPEKSLHFVVNNPNSNLHF